MSEKKYARRFGDMHPTRELVLCRQNNGDIIVLITQDGMTMEGKSLAETAQIEFCINGGQSVKTLTALQALARAMEEDNADYPKKDQLKKLPSRNLLRRFLF